LLLPGQPGKQAWNFRLGNLTLPGKGTNSMKRLVSFLMLAALLLPNCGLANSIDVTVIHIREGHVALEFVGQVNNTPTTSQQFGYLSNIEGLNPIFLSSTPQNETTASFTFVTNATTDRVISNGSLRIVNRTGTTTIYLNSGPSDFSKPASFSQGTPIQMSTYRQQVIINTTTNSFVTVHMNTITQTEPFTLNGQLYQLGREGRSFRTTYSGQVNAPGLAPSGWFAGYAVGAD
jgi:hypothetical protein